MHNGLLDFSAARLLAAVVPIAGRRPWRIGFSGSPRMKSQSRLFPPDASAAQPRSGRRGLLLGAGAAGAAAVAVQVLKPVVPAVPVATATVEPVGAGEGYRLTDHVRRYYETTKA